MPDELDATDIREQYFLDIRIANARGVKIDIVGSGACVVCDNEVEAVECNGKMVIGRWCSVECRDRSDL